MGNPDITEYAFACVLLLALVKEIQSCDYAFVNLDNSINVDWSSGVNTVVFIVDVKHIPTNSDAPDVILTMSSESTNFQVDLADSHQVLVKECLVTGKSYRLTFTIAIDEACTPGVLDVSTISATPSYNIASSELYTSVDMPVFEFFTYAFTIEISNDDFFGGCGSFVCTCLCLNNEEMQFLFNTGSHQFETRKLDIVIGFTYNVQVECLDTNDLGFVTNDHTILVNVTFEPLTTTITPVLTTATVLSTTLPSTTVKKETSTDIQTSTVLTTTLAKGLTYTTLASTTSDKPSTELSSTSTLLTTTLTNGLTSATIVSTTPDKPSTVLTSASDDRISTTTPKNVLTSTHIASTTADITTSLTSTVTAMTTNPTNGAATTTLPSTFADTATTAVTSASTDLTTTPTPTKSFTFTHTESISDGSTTSISTNKESSTKRPKVILTTTGLKTTSISTNSGMSANIASTVGPARTQSSHSVTQTSTTSSITAMTSPVDTQTGSTSFFAKSKNILWIVIAATVATTMIVAGTAYAIHKKITNKSVIKPIHGV